MANLVNICKTRKKNALSFVSKIHATLHLQQTSALFSVPSPVEALIFPSLHVFFCTILTLLLSFFLSFFLKVAFVCMFYGWLLIELVWDLYTPQFLTTLSICSEYGLDNLRGFEGQVVNRRRIVADVLLLSTHPGISNIVCFQLTMAPTFPTSNCEELYHR